MVESISYEGYGTMSVDSVILDPPNCPKTDDGGSSCSGGDSSCCCLQDIKAGCTKEFTIMVPPGVDSILISSIGFSDWRYGGFEPDTHTDSVNKNYNCNASYKAGYRFQWYINLRECNNIFPILALGPYANFNNPSARCIDKSVCLQPLYNNISGGNRILYYSTADLTQNFPAGSNKDDTTVTGDAMANQNNTFSNLGPNFNPTTSATFVPACHNSKNCSPLSNSDLNNLLNRCEAGCLTLFVPCLPNFCNINN